MKAAIEQAEVLIFRELAKCVSTENFSNTIHRPISEPVGRRKITLEASLTAVTCHRFRVEMVT